VAKIQFKKKYKSIANFNEQKIENFSVFIGSNGSGKTHLLEAIREGFVSFDDIPTFEKGIINSVKCVS